MAQGIKGSSPMCVIDGCERASRARGWCSLHYRRWRQYGDPLALRGIGHEPVAARFELQVNRQGRVPICGPHLGPCWEWTGSTDRDGYARFNWGFGSGRAHRYAYERFIGPIPDGLTVDHLCRVRHCVNPAHLEAVTGSENKTRMKAHNAAKTHCPQGHPYDEANTYVNARGWRSCRACGRRKYKARKRGQG